VQVERRSVPIAQVHHITLLRLVLVVTVEPKIATVLVTVRAAARVLRGTTLTESTISGTTMAAVSGTTHRRSPVHLG
jgi:hypothetical protein